MEMRGGEISVGVEAPAQPSDRFGIAIELCLGDTDPHHPDIGLGVARRKAECLVDVGFGFFGSTKQYFGVPDESMNAGIIWLQRQRPLVFSDAGRDDRLIGCGP